MRPLFLAFVACLLCGCSHTFPLSENTEIAKQQIEKLVPVGTSRDEAVKILTTLGFTCSIQRGQYGDETFKDYIRGYCSVHAGWVDNDIWSIVLILKDGQVVDYAFIITLIASKILLDQLL